MRTGRTLRTIDVGESRISSFDISPDGTVIAAGQENGRATAWDVSTGKKLFSVRLPEAVGDIEWSPAGGFLVTATRSGSIRILDAKGEVVRRLNEEADLLLYSARFSPDGRRIVTSLLPERGGSQNFRETIWDWENGRTVDSIAPGNGENAATVAIFDPTGSRIATNGHDGVPRIWDVETGMSLVALPAHPGPPLDIVYSPDGSRVATAGSDGIVRLFDASSGEQLLALRGHEGTVVHLTFSPDGTKLASLGLDGTVRIWALDLDDLLEIARQELKTRTFTDEECRQFLHLEACP